MKSKSENRIFHVRQEGSKERIIFRSTAASGSGWDEFQLNAANEDEENNFYRSGRADRTNYTRDKREKG